jgi:hypothetical protein
MFSARQIVAILFMAVLVGLQGIGIWMSERIANHQQQQHQEAAQHKLIYVHYNLTESKSILWQSDDEIIIDGKLFDVVSMQSDKQGLTVQGFYDHEEDQMRAVYQGHQKKSDYSGQENSFFVPLFFEELPTFSFSGYVLERTLYEVHNEQGLSVVLSATAPPPKSLL